MASFYLTGSNDIEEAASGSLLQNNNRQYGSLLVYSYYFSTVLAHVLCGSRDVVTDSEYYNIYYAPNRTMKDPEKSTIPHTLHRLYQ
jgi:hypothetical protein